MRINFGADHFDYNGGFLDLSNRRDLIELPDGLQVSGSLDLRGCTSVTKIAR